MSVCLFLPFLFRCVTACIFFTKSLLNSVFYNCRPFCCGVTVTVFLYLLHHVHCNLLCCVIILFISLSSTIDYYQANPILWRSTSIIVDEIKSAFRWYSFFFCLVIISMYFFSLYMKTTQISYFFCSVAVNYFVFCYEIT